MRWFGMYFRQRGERYFESRLEMRPFLSFFGSEMAGGRGEGGSKVWTFSEENIMNPSLNKRPVEDAEIIILY